MKKTNICTKCKETKPVEQFRKDPAMRYGYRNQCSQCLTEYSKRRNKTYNRFQEDTTAHMMFEYFSRMNVYLEEEDMIEVVTAIEQAVEEDTYFKTLDELQSIYGADAADYKSELPREIMLDKRDANMGYVASRVGRNSDRKVIQLTLDGEFIAIHDSLADASYAISKSRTRMVGGISGNCQGTTMHSGGFIWQYVNWDEEFWRE